MAATFGTIEQLADYLINGYWTGFTGSPAHHWASHTITYNFGNLNALEASNAKAALDLWSSIANVTFVQTNTSPNISFNHNGPGAFATRDGSTISIASIFAPQLGPGGYLFQTYIHEIGHALGLGHQGPYNNTATYGVNNIFTNDTWQSSIMSYFSQNNFGGSSFAYVVTPEMADIYAIQLIYGAATTRPDDTIYGFHSNAGSIYDFSKYSDVPAFTIYDSGGNDTLDCSGYLATQTIDLVPGHWCSVGGETNNVGIYLTSTIENAIGGSGNDTIVQNSANNVIDGGAGSDTVIYTGLHTNYGFKVLADGSLEVTDLRPGKPDGVDQDKNIEFFKFTDGVFALNTLVPPPPPPQPPSGDANKVAGPQIMYALTGHTENSQAQFDFHAQYSSQMVAFYTNVLHSSAPDLGPYETIALALWNDPGFQSKFASLTQGEFILNAYTTVFGPVLGQQYANTDVWGLGQAIANWEKFYATVPSVYPNPHQAALAVAFGDLIGIGNEVHAQLSQQAAHYVALLGAGAAGYNADLSLF